MLSGHQLQMGNVYSALVIGIRDEENLKRFIKKDKQKFVRNLFLVQKYLLVSIIVMLLIQVLLHMVG